MQHRGLLSLDCIEIRVARTHGQAVGFTHDRANDNLNWKIQVANHLANDCGLSGILLAEECQIRLDDLEELGYDGGHAAKMSRTRAAIELVADALDRDPAAGPARIHVIHRRAEKIVSLFGCEQ